MKGLIYFVVGLILLSIGPKLILGMIFTIGVYYVLYLIFQGITSGSSGSSGGGGSRQSDPGDGWQGTGNPYV